MKILINTPELFFSGGVSEYIKVLALDKEPNIDFYFIQPEIPTASDNFLLVKIYRLISKYLGFIKVAKGYDCIHLNPSFNFKSYYREMGFIALSKMLGKTVIVTMHGWNDGWEERIKQSGLHAWLFKHTYAKVDVYLVLGTLFKQKLQALGVKTQRFFIETTVADDSRLPTINLSAKFTANPTWQLLFLSRIEKEKGIYIALETMKLLSERGYQNVKLTVAGDGGELQAAQEFALMHKINNVEFKGVVQGEAKHQLLLSSHILFFPTYYGEGLPTVILEAMLYGMPIISRVNAAIPDVVTEGDNGFLLTSVAAQDYLSPLEKLFNNVALYQSMATRNHQKALENYTATQVRNRILNIYASCNPRHKTA